MRMRRSMRDEKKHHQTCHTFTFRNDFALNFEFEQHLKFQINFFQLAKHV